MEQVNSSIKVAELYYYPIKSCGGTVLITAEIGPRGIVHDREFMVVDSANIFRTQRKDMRLAQVKPNLEGDVLKLRAPGIQDLDINVTTSAPIGHSFVWDDDTESVDQGNLAAEWFSEFLKKDSRLVRMTDGFVREVNPKYSDLYNQVGYADGYPLLLTRMESLDDLNSRIVENNTQEKPVPMNRFRPNIVILGGGEAFAEDNWTEVQIGNVRFFLEDCARCPIPQTDQETALRGKEPQRTLLSFRPKNRNGFPYFGKYLIHTELGILNIGDKVGIVA